MPSCWSPNPSSMPGSRMDNWRVFSASSVWRPLLLAALWWQCAPACPAQHFLCVCHFPTASSQLQAFSEFRAGRESAMFVLFCHPWPQSTEARALHLEGGRKCWLDYKPRFVCHEVDGKMCNTEPSWGDSYYGNWAGPCGAFLGQSHPHVLRLPLVCRKL